MFPLGTVLFPGLVLPLHIFEERYRDLVRHLVALPADAPREFGVVAIRQGWETLPAAGPATTAPASAAVTLHEVGCTAELRQVTELPDGRFDIVTVGRRRFRDRRRVPGLRVLPDGRRGVAARAGRAARSWPTTSRRGCWRCSGSTSS